MPDSASGRQRIKFSNPQIRSDVARRVRGTVEGMRADANPSYTLRQFCEEAFIAYCEYLEQRYHDGEEWPEATGPLAPGRR